MDRRNFVRTGAMVSAAMVVPKSKTTMDGFNEIGYATSQPLSLQATLNAILKELKGPGADLPPAGDALPTLPAADDPDFDSAMRRVAISSGIAAEVYP